MRDQPGLHDAPILRIAAWSLVAGIVLVPLLFGLAMLFFPSGHCGATDGYSFSRHVISDLGRTRLSNGTPNPVSSSLFAAAMLLTGCVSALFWLARHTFVRNTAARRAALTCGLFASVCLALIGLTPLDRAAALHDPVTGATAIGAALAILALFADSDTRIESRRAKRFWLILLVAVSAVWTVLVVLHHEKLLAFRPWLPLWQKLLITAFVSWLAYQNWCLFRIQQSVQTGSTERSPS